MPNKPASNHRGFTLIELLVTITIFTTLLLLALPMYSEFTANTQIRNGVENTLMGVRQAQSEAIKHNGQVEFVLDPGSGWSVNLIEDNTTLSSYPFADGAARATFTTLPPGATKVTFNGLGRIMPLNPDATSPLTRVNVTSAAFSNPRNMSVIVGAAGLKACVPAVAAPDPQACP
jgi:type IV fimbrial biogenesis protein FimT